MSARPPADPHRHHRAGAHRAAEPPAEPGHPEHPHPAGHLPGSPAPPEAGRPPHWMEMRSITQAQGGAARACRAPAEHGHAAGGRADRGGSHLGAERGRPGAVRPGASVPADGAVVRGSSDVDESMITGESRPVRKGEGDEVIAGTVNQTSSLRVEVTGTGEQTALAGIMRLVAQAQTSRSRAQTSPAGGLLADHRRGRCRLAHRRRRAALNAQLLRRAPLGAR